MRNKDYQIEFKAGRFKEYEKTVLSANLCIHFIPMSFVKYGSNDIVRFDCKGYTSIGQYEKISIYHMLDIMEQIFRILSTTAENLILPSRVTLNADTVFYSKKKNKVKIAYIPLKDDKASLRENVMDFIYQMETKTSQGTRGYFRKMLRCLDIDNYSMNDMADMTFEMKTELDRVKLDNR